MIVEVALVPGLLTQEERKVCIVLDVLRATSTLVAMFEANADQVWLAETPNEALTRAEVWRASGERDVVVCGEVGGLPPVGFDYGNSPTEFSKLSLIGHKLVFSTTNGTRALRHLARSPLVLAGSFLNADAVVQAAIAEAGIRGADIAIVCAGRALGRAFNLEDAACAGYLASLAAQRLQADLLSSVADRDYAGATVETVAGDHFVEESAVGARRLFSSYMAGRSSTPEAALQVFSESASACSLARLGLGHDLEFCAQTDWSALVPRVIVEPGGTMKARLLC